MFNNKLIRTLETEIQALKRSNADLRIDYINAIQTSQDLALKLEEFMERNGFSQQMQDKVNMILYSFGL